MQFSASILVVLLVQFSTAFQDENYDSLESYNSDADDPKLFSVFSRPVRNDAFLRFGRNHLSEDETNDIPNYSLDNFDRQSKSGGEGFSRDNELFVRFGRNKDIFNRLGIPPPTEAYPMDHQHRSSRQSSKYLRFGRSIPEEKTSKNTNKSRTKRDVNVMPESLKRKDNFLRFGRNSNFMRFGRNDNHNKVPYYFPKNVQNKINLARLLRRLELEGYLNHNEVPYQ